MSRRILLTTDTVGGVWRYAVELSRGLAAHGTVTLATVGPPASATQQAELHGATALVDTGLPLDWLADPAALDDASRTLAAIPADVALLHAPAYLRHPWPVPVATAVHSCLSTWFEAVRGGGVPPEYRARADATLAGLRRADRVAAPSAAFAAALCRVHGLTDIAVVHNGRTPLPRPPAPRERAVLTAGRFWDDGKNAALLDRVAPRLSAPIRAAGPLDGPGTRAHLPHLHHLGALDEAGMAAAYAGARVFASPALYEPFGLAVLEAAQAGLALVLSDIPTFRELWDGAALFVPPHDDDAWVAALERALDGGAPDPRAHAARYTTEAMVGGTAALLAAIAG